MDKLQLLHKKFSEFIDYFIVKYSYEHRGMLKKLRIDSRLNMDIDEEEWCKLFLYKSCLNHCARILLMRFIEDKGFIHHKLNEKGIEKWRNFVKNLGQDFDVLYHIGLLDLQVDENAMIRGIFKKSDYDLFTIDKELAEIVIDSFSSIYVGDLQKKDFIELFKKLYTLEDREIMKLEKFHKDAPALSYILQLEERESLL
ncbi:hypothetical protein [Thermotalea metallivorans]|uniref:Uncharacterized protein n=1 Tax=Thermotalea metallivorans TaxID=520762 RepID=A0A140L1B9_9FIRM|nr:hypothetical protein [Thermotalea metallivorans]KXG74344.1 hypothetical protein AN619_24370 [Thermotalea metallivorans]